MKRDDPTGTFCDCLLPDRRLENDTLYCADCGRQIPEARDQLFVTVARCGNCRSQSQQPQEPRAPAKSKPPTPKPAKCCGPFGFMDCPDQATVD
jgi:hypothetical protein